jgi:hypothetical protein
LRFDVCAIERTHVRCANHTVAVNKERRGQGVDLERSRNANLLIEQNGKRQSQFLRVLRNGRRIFGDIHRDDDQAAFAVRLINRL